MYQGTRLQVGGYANLSPCTGVPRYTALLCRLDNIYGADSTYQNFPGADLQLTFQTIERLIQYC